MRHRRGRGGDVRRRLLDFLTALSLLLCVALAAAWVRSLFAADIVSIGPLGDARDGLDVVVCVASHRHGVGGGLHWGDRLARGAGIGGASRPGTTADRAGPTARL